MYEQYFGLTKNAFSMTPDPSALFLTAAHREAIAGLSYGAFSRKGFVVLTGEAGTGKTTLLRRLVELSKEMNAGCNVVFNPLLTSAEFLELLLFNFGVSEMPASKTQRLIKLEELLIETHKKRSTAVLIIDEAHKLSQEIFEEIRLLTNFETGDQKLLQIVLAGQPELKTVLNHPNLRQLKQRIAIRLQIDPLARYQVGTFITYRWTRFGGTAPHPFTAEAVDLIAQCSAGIPRTINAICDNALLLAYSRTKRRVDADIILDVVQDLDLPVPLEEPVIAEPGAGSIAEAPDAKKEDANKEVVETPAPLTSGNGHGTHDRIKTPANGKFTAVTPALAEMAPAKPLEMTPVARIMERPAVQKHVNHAPEPPMRAVERSRDPREPLRVRKLERRREIPDLPILIRILVRLGIVSIRLKSDRRPQ